MSLSLGPSPIADFIRKTGSVTVPGFEFFQDAWIGASNNANAIKSFKYILNKIRNYAQFS